MTTGLIITAAGSGTRFSEKNSKLLHPIDGVPMVLKTCQALVQEEVFSHVVLTTSISDMEIMQQLMVDSDMSIQCVLGGDTRLESVRNGFLALPKVTRVMVHDAARPFVSHDLITRVLKASFSAVAAVPGIPVVDTVKRVENGMVVETLDRSTLIAVQTPQVFQYDVLATAYNEVSSESFTDEASLVEAAGYPVVVVEGELSNRKVTYKGDV